MSIPTNFGGVTMRSRLESRWGAFYDLAGWPWTYEPFDGAGYIPDFAVSIQDRPVLVEVKPIATEKDARAHLPKILAGVRDLWHHDIIICGINPQNTYYLDFLAGPDDWHLSAVNWTACTQCVSVVAAAPGHWGDPPCAHCQQRAFTDGTHTAATMWREAGNRVQWRAAS